LNLELTDEQTMLQEAAGQALDRQDTVSAAREARDGAEPLDLWPTAREAGWSGLLVSEEHGGAGLGVLDAMLVMEECGKRLGGSGLLGHLPATLVLSRAAAAGDEAAAQLLPDLAGGARRAALVHAETAIFEGQPLSGEAEHVPDLDGADVIVLAIAGDDGPRAALVEAGGAGVDVERQIRGDASRPLGKLRLDHVGLEEMSGVAIEAGPRALAEAWYCAQAMLAADALGVSEAMLEMSVAYAQDRHTFGRPIGSYQAVKHQLVEILRRIDRVRSLCTYVGLTVESQPEELPMAASAARFAAEESSDYATRTCIAVHGGIGATWEHDAPYYWRRSQLSRLLLGGRAGAGDRIAAEAIASVVPVEPAAA
jgi:alkylation response protein AidB-like acyl-CoA dehydrogenase